MASISSKIDLKLTGRSFMDSESIWKQSITFAQRLNFAESLAILGLNALLAELFTSKDK
jgi:hypothetical protein